MVKNVLAKRGDILKNLLEDSLEDFASKMHKEGLIGDYIQKSHLLKNYQPILIWNEFHGTKI